MRFPVALTDVTKDVLGVFLLSTAALMRNAVSDVVVTTTTHNGWKKLFTTQSKVEIMESLQASVIIWLQGGTMFLEYFFYLLASDFQLYFCPVPFLDDSESAWTLVLFMEKNSFSHFFLSVLSPRLHVHIYTLAFSMEFYIYGKGFPVLYHS